MRQFPVLIALVAAALPACAQTQLTIYNQNFASVKERRTFDLKAGENEVRVSGLTAHLEPDSVVLRDVRQPASIRILEQNYESDPLSEALLLRKSEGKTLDFEMAMPDGSRKVVQGRILRSGYVPHSDAYQRYGQQYYQRQMALSNGGAGQAIVEVAGKIYFGLPGKPIFDSLDPKAFLNPTLLWKLWTDRAGAHETEFSYLTGGMRWDATYNAVASEKSNTIDLIGWVTLENMSGKDFESASVKLMAGDVARAPQEDSRIVLQMRMAADAAREPAPVTERAFDEYHLYTLPRPTTVLDREIKQVEFVRASGVPAQRIYVYDGFQYDSRYRGWNYENIRGNAEYGTASNSKVFAMLEFRNAQKSGLGMPLPRGKVKVYRTDQDGRNEFVGEDSVDHTPQDETVRLYTGNAFDIVGERKQTNFLLNSSGHQADETFEIKVRNHKKETATVRVVEHMYRSLQWEVTAKSAAFTKKDSKTIEFRPVIPAGGEAVISYTVHYSW